MDPVTVTLAVVAAALGSGGLVSWLHIRTVRDKTVSETNKNTSEAQALIIKNLQAENARMTAEIKALRRDVAELRGQYKTLERFKVQEIADLTADRVLQRLIGDHEIPLEN